MAKGVLAMRDKPNKGFLKEIKKTPKPQAKTPFSYKKPVSKVEQINSMAVNSRTREFKSVKQDKTTNFAIEQNNAKASHKGSK